ncbi:hypothetical protein Pmani_019281 [Petrolisthes manimaculis]|uniref:Uncharacterized protein n=1 Tax=Petrolisthes manimaculis TaxID=1843537 RepID=A0AAE1PIH3_9EUCA|nr:hypothetical protein Pmani_019281 [Petrolisthes manimaculis]
MSGLRLAVRLYPFNFKSEEKGVHVFDEAGLIVLKFGVWEEKTYYWLDKNLSTMTPSDDFYNIPLPQVIKKAQTVKQGAASPNLTTEEFNSSNFVRQSMVQRVESIKGNLKSLSEYLEFFHDILSTNEDQPPK